MAAVASVPTGWPTRSELASATFQHLGQAADWWDRIAVKAESAFEEVARQVRRPGGVEWEGAAGDQAVLRSEMDLVKVRGRALSWRDAAQIARRGQDSLEANQQEAREAIDEARRDGFEVGEDYSVTDTRRVSTRAELAVRQGEAEAHASFIRHRVARLVANDTLVASRLGEVTAGFGNLTFEEAPANDGSKGRIHAVDNRTFKEGPSKDDDDDKKHGGSKSFGKGSTTHVKPHGDTEQQWGHPTDPHEIWPNVPGKAGTFDGDHGKWEWHGPGSQGEAYGSQHTDGITGKADAGAWAAKGEATWSRDVFGNPLTGSANGEVGVHGNADAAVTDHGISLGADAFGGAELGGKADYNLGPVDLSLGGAAQLGAGGGAHLDAGMEDGKLVFGGTLGLAWGPGGKISPHIAIDPKAVVGGLTEAGQWLSGLFN